MKPFGAWGLGKVYQADCLSSPPSAPTHVSKNILLICSICVNNQFSRWCVCLGLDFYSWATMFTMVGRCLAKISRIADFHIAQGMSIFFDDGGVGNNGQTGWWIAEEESFGESCLLWCPGGVIKCTEASCQTWSPMKSLKALHFSKPSPKFPQTSMEHLLHGCYFDYPQRQVLVVACRRPAGNGVATWVGTRWICMCCRKMLHRIHGAGLWGWKMGMAEVAMLCQPWDIFRCSITIILIQSDPFCNPDHLSLDFVLKILILYKMIPLFKVHLHHLICSPTTLAALPLAPRPRTWNRIAWSSQGICCWMSWDRPLFAPWIPMDPLGSPWVRNC